MSTEFTKGQLLTAIDLNELADAACMNIIGGPGCAVTRLGKKVVVSERTGQKIPKKGIGCVWRVNTGLGIDWVRDTGHASARQLAVDETYCYVFSRTDVSLDDLGIFQYTVSGTKNWAEDYLVSITSGFQQSQMAIIDGYLFTFGHSDGDAVKKIDLTDGTELGAIATGVNIGTSSGARSDGTNIWFYCGNTAPAVNWLRKLDVSLGLTSYADGTGTTKGAGGYPINMVLPASAGIFVAAHNLDNWASDQTAIKLDTSPTFAWGTSLTGASGGVLHTRDVAYESSTGSTYWVGARNNTFPAGGGDYASIWKLDSSGAVVWYVDTGGGTNSVNMIGDAIYVIGDRSNSWPGAGGYATVWKLDSDGNIDAVLDFGTRIFDSADTVAYQARANSTHLFVVTDRAVSP